MAVSLAEIAANFRSEDIDLARARCVDFIAASPEDAEAHHLLALIEYRRGALINAAKAARSAATLAPQRADYWNTLGTALAVAARPQEAVDAFERAHMLEASASTTVNLGNALLDAGRFDEAIAVLGRGAQHAPSHYGLAIAKASALQAKSDLQASLAEFERATLLQPHPLEALAGRADTLRLLGREQDALQALDVVLAHDASNLFALQTSASLLHKRGELEVAHHRYMQLWILTRSQPGLSDVSDYALSMVVSSARAICEWSDDAALEAELLRRIKWGAAAVPPIVSFALFDDTEVHAVCAQRHFRRELPADPPRQSIVVRDRKRLRLGYLSADFREHPTARLIAGLIEDHDRDRFEVCAFSSGPDDGSALRARLVRAFDSFTEIGGLGDEAAAAAIAQSEIDILVDLSGPMAGARPGVVARRPAPLVAHFIGSPGPPGMHAVDYFIADRVTVPTTERGKFGCAVVRLPSTIMPIDPRPETAVLREKTSDHPDEFVFFALCQSIKLSREVFETWMRILARAPASVLWLLEDNRFLRRRLEFEAQSRGVDPARLVFFPRVDYRTHMARQRMADLVLDTWPCGAHTTAVEALSCGVPIITTPGKSFASRVGASVLNAADMRELIANSVRDYEDSAVQISQSAKRRSELRARLENSRRKSALFDSSRHRRFLESAYEEMWRRFRSGHGPQSFDVDEMCAPSTGP